jgi:hypothetical protein
VRARLVPSGISIRANTHSSRMVGNPDLTGLWKGCPSSAQNPKPARPGRERYRCLRQERIIKARDSAMLAT